MKNIYLFFFFLLLNLAFCEECTEKDYGATFTECDQNIRQGAFYWYEPKTCTGGVSLPDSFQDLDCSCTLQDYKITYLQCVNETRTKAYVKDTDCVDGEDPPSQEKVACECTTNDYEAIYSDCLSESRDVNYFWKTPKKCVGGVELPDRIEDLPCDIYCGKGTYLPIGKTACQDCEAGSYSIGSGEHYYDWDEWPTSKFTTYCKKKESSSNANYFRILNKNRIEDFNLHANVIEPLEGIMDIDLGDESDSDDCKGWQLGGTFIYSGNNGTSLSNSTLEYWDHFITDDDNSIEFTYQVEGEKRFDGLYFMIDDEIKLGLISSQVEPQNVTFEVTKGLHKFKWIYVKDVSVDVGNDNVVITEITVRGNKWANSECTDCKTGWFSAEGSPKCSECERNTYTDQEGMSECLDCNATQYSNPGSSKCIERKPCTDSDYEPYFSDCDADHKRTQYWRLIEPSICLEQDPPANNTDQPCKVCDPGQIEVEREKDGETIYVCDFCPEGKYRESINDDNVCVANPEGTYSPKSRYFHNLESFPEEFTTNCEGECGTPGWRLADDHLDSGEGHLGKATSSLNYKFELENLGYLKLDFEQDCESSSTIWYLAKCGTIIYLDGYYVGGYLGSQERQTYDLTIYDLGEHEITIQFFKRYESETDTESNGDGIKLYELVIEGLTEGGAYNYHNCSEGSYSLGTNSNCTLCDPGTYSGEEGSAECLECPENTFSRKYGSEKCKECGSGTSSNQGATECDNNNCVFKFGQDRVYDISKLADPNKMEGPISTNTINEFYINLCYYNTSTAYCLDEVDGALITRGCQKNINYNYSLDIGDTIDVIELNSDDAAASVKSNGRRFDDSGIEDCKSNPHDGINLSTSSNEPGLVYRLINGDEGCGGERYTNITLICDISKGKGEIEPVGDIENPSYSCHYEFIWRSQYACRQCLERDYNHYYTDCNNKTRTKIYYWVKNPRECYGGVPLPEDETVECDSLLTCPSGTYSDGKNCTECIEGRYSSGNDEYLESELLNDISDSEGEKATFQTGCTGKGCTPFAFDSNVIKSGTGTTSWLKLEKEFSVKDGDKKVGFLFNEFLINEDSDDYLEKFSFIIDGIEVFSHYTKSYIQHEFQQIEFNINSTGIHEFTWMVYNINNINRGIHIKQISTINSDLSKSSCNDCGFGFFANSTKSDVCEMCPQNTYSDNYGAVVCQSCSGDDYSYQGSKQCQPKVECTDQDWYIEYQDCDPKNRKRIGYYKFYEPKACIGDLPSNNEIVEDCLPCYPGSFLNPTTNLCEKCSDGSYSDQINSAQCHQSEAGHAAIKTINWVSFENSNANTENLQFTTTCTGRGCGFSQGWRLRGDYLDSGVGRINDQQMFNSILQIKSEIEIVNENGYLEFTTKFDNPRANLYVLINEQLGLELNEPVLDWEAQHITLQPGVIEIAFIYIQDENPSFNTTDDKGLAYLKDIKFFGTLSGSATQQVPCSNGYYSSNPGLVECQICQPGTYSSTKPEGNSQCIPCPSNQYNTESGSRDCFTCGEGTSGNKESGSTECVNTCTYSVDEKTIFDFSEINSQLGVQRVFNQDAGDYIYFGLCSKIDDTEFCNDEESFVCQNKTSFGKILSFSYPLPAEKYPNSNGLMIEYLPQVHLPKLKTNGDHDHHHSRHSSFINEEEEGQSKTILYMVCDQNAGIGEPTIINSTSNSNNEIVLIEMEWKSLYACRLCQMPDDFKQINGACENGESAVHYEQISSDCWNNLVTPDESVACKEVQLKQYIIYGSMGAIGLAAIGLMLVCWQKRKLKHKYTRIEKQNRTTDNGLFGENDAVVIGDDDDIIIQNDDKSTDENEENQKDSSNKDIVRIENSSDNDNVPLFSSSEKDN
ncbi:hypothetical protein M0813_22502 [Anaeramoeba flamelloides]|uniref:MRH domain-containing protein n=1 Tax=Anaeramoeba flamelloides TaxID=1746091 RepID=A0ABQ8YCT1_9EUKA|nr:hypothetical protein M0813_22502 [Anaeramoeba flamelloides]